MFSYAFKKLVQHLVPIIAIVALVGVVGFQGSSYAAAPNMAGLMVGGVCNVGAATTSLEIGSTYNIIGFFDPDVTLVRINGTAQTIVSSNITCVVITVVAGTTSGDLVVTNLDGTDTLAVTVAAAATATTASGKLAGEFATYPLGSLPYSPTAVPSFISFVNYAENLLLYTNYATVLDSGPVVGPEGEIIETVGTAETVDTSTIPLTQACVLPGLGTDFVDIPKFEEVTGNIYAEELGYTWLGPARDAEPKPRYDDEDLMEDGVFYSNLGYLTGVSVNEVDIDNRLSPVPALTRVTYILDPFDGEGGSEELLSTRVTPPGVYDKWQGVGLVPLTLPEDVEPGTQRCGYLNVDAKGCGGEDESYKFCVQKSEEEEDDFCDILPAGTSNNFPNDYYEGDWSLFVRANLSSYPTIPAQMLAGLPYGNQIGLTADGRVYGEGLFVPNKKRGMQGTTVNVTTKDPIPLNTDFVAWVVYRAVSGDLNLYVYANKKTTFERVNVGDKFSLDGSDAPYIYTPFRSTFADPRGVGSASKEDWGVVLRAISGKDGRSFRFCPKEDFEDTFDIEFSISSPDLSFYLRPFEPFRARFAPGEPPVAGDEEVIVEFTPVEDEEIFDEEIFDVFIELLDEEEEVDVVFEPAEDGDVEVSLERIPEDEENFDLLIELELIEEEGGAVAPRIQAIRELEPIKSAPSITILSIRELEDFVVDAPVAAPAAIRNVRKPSAVAGKPVIASVVPDSAAPGDIVTIRGSFAAGDAWNIVRIGSIAMLVKSDDGTTLVFKLPASGPSGCGYAGICTEDIVLLMAGRAVVRVSNAYGTSNDWEMIIE